jgi:hypothetical protein
MYEKATTWARPENGSWRWAHPMTHSEHARLCTISCLQVDPNRPNQALSDTKMIHSVEDALMRVEIGLPWAQAKCCAGGPHCRWRGVIPWPTIEGGARVLAHTACGAGALWDLEEKALAS